MMIRTSGGGRDELFEKMYRKYYARMYRYFRRCGVADDEAHDLAQDAFKRVYESMQRYRGDAEWAFLETVALNVLRNWVRARKTQKRNARLVDIDDRDEVPDEPMAPPERDYAEQEEQARNRARLHHAIKELSEGQRQALTLWLHGLPYAEIAKALRTTVDAVKSRLRDAKKILSAQLGGGLPEEEE